MRQLSEKALCLNGNIGKMGKPMVLGDDVEEIAVRSCLGIRPFSDSAFAGFRPAEPDIHRFAWSIHDVANDPISAGPPAIRQILAAHRLSMMCKAACQFGCGICHEATTLLALAADCAYGLIVMVRIALKIPDDPGRFGKRRVKLRKNPEFHSVKSMTNESLPDISS